MRNLNIGKHMNLADIINPDIAVPGTPVKWGYRKCSEDEYRSFPAVNNSLLKCYTLHEMYRMLVAPPAAQTNEALALGTLFDIALLTPEETWTDRFAAADVPINKTTGKAYGIETAKAATALAEAAAANPGKFIVTLDQFKEIEVEMESLIRAVMANDLCRSRLTHPCLKQVSGFMWHPNWRCWVKWKPDLVPLSPDDEGWALDDLKSTRMHVAQFHKDANKFGYREQALWYAHCHQTWMAQQGITLNVANFNFIVAGKADAESRQPRGAMARMIQLPLNPTLNLDMVGPYARIFPEDGLGIIERFVAALHEHLDTDPDPADEAAINRIWSAYENESTPWILARRPMDWAPKPTTRKQHHDDGL